MVRTLEESLEALGRDRLRELAEMCGAKGARANSDLVANIIEAAGRDELETLVAEFGETGLAEPEKETPPADPTANAGTRIPARGDQEVEPGVLMVRPGRTIFWTGTKDFRGSQGYCVAADDPFIAPYMHNLGPAPKGCKPDPIPTEWDRRWRAAKAEKEGREGPGPEPTEREEKQAALASEVDEDLPDRDE